MYGGSLRGHWDSPMEETLLKKIPDESLVRFARSQSSERQSVIIEVDLPPMQADLKKPSQGNVETHVPARVLPQTAGQRAAVERTMSKYREDLERVVGAKVTVLKYAQAFVATVDPTQLREIAAEPSTRSIRPNRARTLKAGAAE